MDHIIDNPFSPVFGGKPRLFFDRKRILRRFVRALRDEETKTVDPQLSVSILGSGGSVGGMSTPRTTRVERGGFDLLLIDAYSSRALRPKVDELLPVDVVYLVAMAQCLTSQRVAYSSDVAHTLGKDTRQASPARARLQRNRIVLAPRRGQLVFAVPYLADYVLDMPEETDEVEHVRSWGV